MHFWKNENQILKGLSGCLSEEGKWKMAEMEKCVEDILQNRLPLNISARSYSHWDAQE